MKYKDFQRLSQDEMKRITGGYMPPPDNTCKADQLCTVKSGNTTTIYKCKTVTANNTNSCICENSQGVGCAS